MIPFDFLESDIYVSYAPGTTDLSANGAPVYITALNDDTSVFIDYGPNDGVFDKIISLNRLNVAQLFAPDNNNTGMHIVATSPVASAWGANPDASKRGRPYLDTGYTILPLPEAWIDVTLNVDKTVSQTTVQVDETVTFTIVISVPADSTDPATGVDLEDTLPPGWDYVVGSGTPFDPVQSGDLLTWAGDWTISPGNSVTITFQAKPTASADRINPNLNVATATGEVQGAPLTADDDAFVTVVTAPSALKSAVDQNGGNLEPGDEILYTITIENPNHFDLNDVRYEDPIPANTTYNANSVSLPPGSTLTATSPTLKITGITVPARGQTLITFLVTVDNPLPVGVTQIENQGTFFYNDGIQERSEKTDGDTTVSGAQPTILPVTAGANFNETTKSVNLYKDADGNGVASPGDTLRYTVVIPNTGNLGAAGVSFIDPIPTDTTYVTGSVNAGSGTAQYVGGNNRIEWSGNISAGSSVTITFDVTINNGIVMGTVISNQGTVNGTVLTDGNTNEPGDQPTDVTVGGSPEGLAIKSVTDVNGGNLEPGDELLYTIVMQNKSGFNVTGIEFTDVIPANTTYKAASISSPAGSTVVSTSPTLRITGINVPARGEVIISFTVTVDNPLPAGVTEIANQGTVFYDSDGDGINDSFQQTDGDTAKPGENPTTIPVTAGPNFNETTKSVSLQKDADGNGFVSPGDTLRYTVFIPNTGNQDSSGAVPFLDPLPANTTYVAGSANASSGTVQYVAADNRIEWSGPIAADSSVTIMFDVTINMGIATGIIISNQGTVNGTILTDGDTAQPGDQTTDVVVGGSPQGIAIKSVTDVNGGNLEPGDDLSYTIIMRNQSGFNATGIEFTDVIPTNTTYKEGTVTSPVGSTVVSTSPTLRITGINVPAHGEVIITFLVVVDNPLPAGVGEIANQGVVFYDSDGDGHNDSFQNTDGNTAQPGNNPTIIPVTAGPNFSETTKGVNLQDDLDHNGVVSPGDTLRYTVIIPNTGNQDSSGAVHFQDPLPANTTYVAGSATADSGTVQYVAANNRIEWSGTIAAGATVTIAFDVTVDGGILTGTTISNQGTVNGTINTDGDTGQPGAQPTDVKVGGSPHGVAAKTVTDSSGGFLKPGDELLYTIDMKNESIFNVVGIEFVDVIPANTTYVNGSVSAPVGSTVVSTTPTLRITGIDVPPHGLVTITFKVRINDPLPQGFTTIINSGTVYYDSDGSGHNDSVQATDGDPDTPGNQPTSTSTASISGTVFDDPNGDGTQDEGSTPLPNVTVEVQDQNETVLATTTTDDNGFYQFVVPPGDYVVVETDPPEYESITPNKVSVSVPSGGISNVNFADMKENPVISMDKADSVDPVAPGATLLYTIGYSNNGGSAATNAVITETYDPNVTFVSANPAPDSGTDNQWTIGNLAPGASGSITVTVRVETPLPGGTQLVNKVVLVSDQGTSSADETTTVEKGEPTVLGISKIDTPDPVIPGDNLTYTIKYGNDASGGTATHVVITETYDPNVTFVSATPAPDAGTNNQWTIGNLAPGESGTITVTVKVASKLPNGTQLVNTVEIRSDQASASAQAVTTVKSGPILTLAKTDHPDPVKRPDGKFIYTITYSNEASASEAATNVVITETYDPNVNFVSADPEPDPGTDNQWTIGKLSPGESGTITLVVRVDTSLNCVPLQLINTVELTSDQESLSAQEVTTFKCPEIPTLDQWGMLILTLLIGWVAIYSMRARKRA